MNELICPNCDKVFKVDKTEYATIQKQVRDHEFKEELKIRLRYAEKEKHKHESRRRRGPRVGYNQLRRMIREMHHDEQGYDDREDERLAAEHAAVCLLLSS